MEKVMWRIEITFVGQETGKVYIYQATRALLETGILIYPKLTFFLLAFIDLLHELMLSKYQLQSHLLD